MIVPLRTLDAIRAGAVTVAFRRWRRPTVRSGGTLLTAAGQLEIVAVTPIDIDTLSAADARRAGYESLDALLAELNLRREGVVYRIELGALHPDPRVALRQAAPASDDERAALVARVARLDARAPSPWTRIVLELIERHPAVRAADLARAAHVDRDTFKVNVRKLKALGLTESLEIGYRLSPRGSAYLSHLRRTARLLLMVVLVAAAAACRAPAPESAPPVTSPAQRREPSLDSSPSDPWRDAQERGVEFRALGQEPGWFVEIDEQQAMHVVWDYMEQQATVPAPPRENRDGAVVYIASADGRTIAVRIEEQPCTDVMSGAAFPQTVRLTIGDRTLDGCGRFLQ